MCKLSILNVVVSPLLNIGITLAILYLAGNVLVCSTWFIITVSDVVICGSITFKGSLNP